MADTGSAPSPHAHVSTTYISTACVHGLCAEKGACRQTCKFCDAPCACPCHRGSAAALPEPWVDQARDVARELYEAALSHGHGVLPPVLAIRALDDPALFWLRGEERPPGEWHEPHAD
jgi:hypothetical protein